MNVSELARKLHINSVDLLSILPEYGFDIGKRAIKVDDRIARKIMDQWPEIQRIELRKAQIKQEEERALHKETVVKKKVEIPPLITVRDFATLVEKPVNIVIKELMKNGVMASLNQKIDFETASIIADDLDVEVIPIEGEIEEETSQKLKDALAKEEKVNLLSRPPVVVVMGHVDHGKTKLLDAIRTTNVMEGEAGGITQHIGAYQVTKKNQVITFIDTPGHEAFTAMRSRGAKIADIAILVIAANDSIKPQTLEAIKIIQQAGLPMIVAINKIDLEDANVEKVKQDLAQLNLIPEDWGGKTICVPISAKKGLGIDEILDMVLLVADMEKEKIVANPQADAIGTVIEAHIDKGEGPVATVLVQNGTLKRGDNICINDNFIGKVRAMRDYINKDTLAAPPSSPVKIIGLKYAPVVGDIVQSVCEIDKSHKKFKAFDLRSDKSMVSHSVQSDEDQENAALKYNVILRADVLGSLEVLIESLAKLETEDVKIKVVAKGLGNINDNDVAAAESAGAIIFGFNVKPTLSAADLAREKKVTIKTYQVIYHMLEFVEVEIKKLKKQVVVRNIMAKVSVLAIFKTENKSMIVGGKVLSGKIEANSQVDISRNNEFIDSGDILEIRAGKEVIKEAVEGSEIGIAYKGKPVIAVGDILEVYREEMK